ncbi:MAG TPA: YafY family protein [Sphingomonadaceae bacterium]|jgi:predicted DNA-binding transcriptional regulator YafY|nr:YafY family protein [Sphingomonadaceae bacterium]
MRASRLISILTTLQAKGRVTAQALADECEVSLRTIYRDIDALSAAGIPVYSERGNAGGYRLLDGYRTRLNGLSSAEAEALFLAGLTRQTADLGLGAVAATARTKLLAAMPAEVRAGADRMRARFHLDAPTWFGEGESLDHLPTVADAVWRERPMRIRYRSWTSEGERRVEPLGIVLKGGAWYLVGRVEASVRTYRISRILDLEVLDEQFVQPGPFDLEAYWSENIRRLEAELHPHQATVRLSPRGMRMMESILPAYVRVNAVIGAPDHDGWHTATMPAATPDHAVGDLLRFGTEIEILGTKELRAQMAATVRWLADTYREPAGRHV